MEAIKKKRSKWKIFGLVLLALLVFFGVCFALPRPQATDNNRLRIADGARPLLIAHGGGNREFPDNTLEAFQNAYGIDPTCMMETDVSMTKDGVIILSHDTTLDRKTNVSGAISDWAYSDLVAQQVDFGYENAVEPESNGHKVSEQLVFFTNFEGQRVKPTDVPHGDGYIARDAERFLVTTLEELIVSFPDNTINVEIKQSGETGRAALAAVIALLERLDGQYDTFDRVVLASFHKEIYDDIVAYADAHDGVLYSPQASGVTALYVTHWLGLDVFVNSHAAVLQLPMEQMGLNLHTSFFINAMHRHNMAVHYWTIDDADDMRLLAKRGADGIMTNIPSRLKAVLDELYPQG